MPRANKGILVECDPSIKAILLKIDEDGQNKYIIEVIDDQHLLVQTDQHERLKMLLKEALKDTVKVAEADSEEE